MRFYQNFCIYLAVVSDDLRTTSDHAKGLWMNLDSYIHFVFLLLPSTCLFMEQLNLDNT